MNVVTTPDETVCQVSGYDPEGRSVLAVVVKRTYHVDRSGRCVLAEKQLALHHDAVADEATGALLHDPDIFPFKPLTDVVVLGHAYARDGETSFRASVSGAGVSRAMRVSGDRRCALDAFGRVLFSEPSVIEKVPLRYDFAYGGRDAAAEARYGNPFAQFQLYAPAIDMSAASPWLYPRNPVGRGFLVEVTPEAIEALALPNLEDPDDLLTPERVAARYPSLWPAMPLPACTAWADAAAFPRCAWFGLVPEHDGFDAPFPEVARGLAPAEMLTAATLGESLHPRFANGASLGLQAPHLRGDEEFLLARMHPAAERWSFRLPGQRPTISTDGRNGKLNATEARIHSVVIEPDEDRVSVLWAGSALALRPYMPDELARMPLRVAW